MTKNEFEYIIRDLYKSNNRLNTITAFVLMIIGLYFFAKSIITLNSKPELNLIYFAMGTIMFAVTPILAGILMLNKIPKQYMASELLSKLSLEEKMNLFRVSISEYDFEIEEFSNFIHIGCKKKYDGKFDIYLYIDEEKYLFNVITRGSVRANGPFDFGASKKITNRINASLQQTV